MIHCTPPTAIAAVLVGLLCACSGGEVAYGGGGEGSPAGAPRAGEPSPSGQPVASPPAAVEPGDADSAPPGGPESWTAGRTSESRSAMGVATLREMRIARQEGFDRVVFVFDGGIPSYTAEYVDRPVRACGSGDVVDVAGDGWLRVGFTPARAHTDAGQATVTDRDRRPGLPVIRQVRAICDFEAHLDWVIGTGSPNRYRVFELADPDRVVVDVRH